MPTLRIEHRIHDYGTWKTAFDRDPVGRAQAGVLRYAIHQPVDDPLYVLIDLEFASVGEAERLLTNLQRNVWTSATAAPALAGTPRVRIIDTVEEQDVSAARPAKPATAARAAKHRGTDRPIVRELFQSVRNPGVKITG